MKNSIKIYSIICIILTTIVLLTSNVCAANDSFKTKMTVSNSTVTKEDEFTVAIELNSINIESGEKGIGAYTAKLDYDSSVLEIEKTDGAGSWEDPVVEGKLIVGNTSDGKVVSNTTQIGTITFKVKDSAKIGETTISLSNFYGSNAVDDILGESSSVKVNIVDNNGNDNNDGDSNQTGDGSNNQEGNTSNTQDGNQNSNGDSNGDSNSGSQNGNVGLVGDNTGNSTNGGSGTTGVSSTNNGSTSYVGGTTTKQAPKSLPKTGESNIVIYMLLSISSIIAISYLIKMKSLDK